MRRFGECIDPGRTYRDRPGAYGVILHGREALVTEQTHPRHEFQLPGGGVDPGEGPVRALHRECLEETGWRIQILRRLGAFQRYCHMPEYEIWARKVCHIYLCRPVLRRGAPADPAHRAVWMPVETAADLLAVEGDRHFLRLALRNGVRSGRAGSSTPES